MAKNKTETLDDNSYASDPGKVLLSHRKLRRLRPDLYGVSGWIKALRCRVGLGWPQRTYIEEQLQYGDSRAAVVVSLSPLLVAAYSDEIDCVAVLRFPREFADDYRLSIGSRLLTVNTYAAEGRDRDLIVGPREIGRYYGFHPIIADFISEDEHGRIDARKREISEEEWARTRELGKDYLRKRPRVARDGRPVYAGVAAELNS